LATEYDRPLSGTVRWRIYAGVAGEPALGPAAYPHRLSAMANPLAPISHHWLDATHITFGDPDFLNGPGHALAVTRALHAEFPTVTFDFTAKVEHLLRHARHLPELGRLGCAFVVTAALTLAMLAGSAIAWNRQDPFISQEEGRALSDASESVSRLEPGTPLAFLVNEPDDTVSFLATRAGNVIRAGVPPDRIRDVVVVVPSLGAGTGSGERGALERLTARDLAAAEDRAGRSAAVIVLTPFDEVDRPTDAILIGSALVTGDGSRLVDPLEPASAARIAWAAVATLALLWVAGFGWARIGLADTITAAAAAPAIGAAMLILVATALDALGVPLGRAAGALAASALAGGGGYLIRFVLERRAGSGAAPQVQEQPAK